MNKPLVVISGAAGHIGSTLAAALDHDYEVVGMDLPGKTASFPLIDLDLGSDESVRAALQQLRSRYGERIASVVHLPGKQYRAHLECRALRPCDRH
jgi:nucleoside-diphosphate-sugar epimerase